MAVVECLSDITLGSNPGRRTRNRPERKSAVDGTEQQPNCSGRDGSRHDEAIEISAIKLRLWGT